MAFDTSLRDEAVRRAVERCEQSRLRIIGATESALSELAAAAGIREAYLFGSVTRPHGSRDESDVDMAIAGTVRDPVALCGKAVVADRPRSPHRRAGGSLVAGSPMDSAELVTIERELAAQMREIERVYDRIEERASSRTTSQGMTAIT